MKIRKIETVKTCPRSVRDKRALRGRARVRVCVCLRARQPCATHARVALAIARNARPFDDDEVAVCVVASGDQPSVKRNTKQEHTAARHLRAAISTRTREKQ